MSWENNNIVLKSPSKIILTGEHLFFYSKKAIVKKIDNFLFFKSRLISDQNKDKYIDISLERYKIKKKILFSKILNRYNNIIMKYNQFLKNEIKFEKILNKKDDFCIAIIGFFLKNYNNYIQQSFKLKVSQQKKYIQSKGLGSSASFILGIINSLQKLFQLNLKKEEIFEIAILFENFKHGKSSGIDIICILENKKNFIAIEKDKNLNSLDKHQNIIDLYLNFNQNISNNYNFLLNDFKITELENFLIKDLFLHKTFINKNKFSTFDIIKIVNKKKNYITENLTKIEEIFINFIISISNKNIDINKRKKLFIETITENNNILYNLDIIPDKDMMYIKKMQNLNYFGKITGSGGIKNIDKSVGCIILFLLKNH